MRRVAYLIWGSKILPYLERSLTSLYQIHPKIEALVVNCDEKLGLVNKTLLAQLPSKGTTLLLDADTVVLGNLDQLFEGAERYGLACTIADCPWMRRYSSEWGNQTEYSTGVIAYTKKALPVLEAWERLGRTTHASNRWEHKRELKGEKWGDQASFAAAICETKFNPYILPMNYNFVPWSHRSFFAPLKIWHSRLDVPDKLRILNQECEAGNRLVNYCCIEDYL